jgi:N,N'-diacetyllegionaminate synthase
MRALIVAELATAHGGDIELAADMIRAAADAGADLVKLQSYSLARLNPADAQREWLIQSHLDESAHVRLLEVGQQCGVEIFSTPFDADSLAMLRRLGLTRFKVASSESGNDWWLPAKGETWIVSWPWGGGRRDVTRINGYDLTAIPLYPTPLEAVGRATLLDGWSDHTVGLSACYWALAQGIQMLEVHLALAGRSRVMPFDKSPAEIRALRQFAEDVCTMKTGVSQRFRDRWSA